MKMARASEQDLEAALTVSRIIEELEKGYMPGDDNAEETEFFDQDDPEHCKRALDAILSAAHQGSIFRVTFGMAVVLDPRNKLLDPDADTLELHPDLVRKAASVAAPAAGDALPNLPRGWQLALNLAIDAIENAAPAGQHWPVNWPAILHGLTDLRAALAAQVPQQGEA